MTRNKKIALLALVLAGSATAAIAARGIVENDALAIANARITLVQAITAAEQHANGRASRAEYEHSKQGWLFEVEVVSGTKVFDVRVDADKGTVISSTEDKADHEDDDDKDK